MFRNKRNNLIKRLWKASHLKEIRNERNAVEAMLKRLTECQLALLLRAVESGGADLSECVPITHAAGTVSPHVLFCQAWRWTNLRSGHTLKKLPCCLSTKETVCVCCNPYHWSRLSEHGNTESPSPPYSSISDDILKSRDNAECESVVSQATGGTMQCGSVSSNNVVGGVVWPLREWCSMAYWEQCQRVGRLFPVFPSCTHVFSDTSQGDGMCLATLATQHPDADEAVRRTRDKIGLGLILSREVDGVWMYNRSDNPIFVNSPTLDPPNSRTFVVFKVLPGYSVKIFDYERAQWLLHDVRPTKGPHVPNTVRISFVKGWGLNYSRQFVTSCPCWLEILLYPCR